MAVPFQERVRTHQPAIRQRPFSLANQAGPRGRASLGLNMTRAPPSLVIRGFPPLPREN